LTRRRFRRDPTHALFADQSHSIPDNIVALFGRMRAWNYSAETARSAVGCSPCSGSERVNCDPIEELTNLAEKIYREFLHSIFFTSKLIFERDNWYIRQLHSEAALTMLRRLHLRNMPMVILPMKL
jgi:hypothetical protein